MKRYKRIILIMGLVMVFSMAGIRASAFENNSLIGIKGVYVIVSSLYPEVEEAGLTNSQIQSDVELKLRLAGIKVLNYELKKMIKETGEITLTKPAVFIYVTSRKGLQGAIVYNISCELQQTVILVRNPSIETYATTWNDSALDVGSIKDMRELIKDVVDKFINAYLAVNPKK
jgi:hypothetical protein